MRVPTMAELDALVEAAKTNPKRKRRKSGSSWGGRRNSKRTNYASQVIARGGAMAELVGRVNGEKEQDIQDDCIPFQGESCHYSEDADWKVKP